MAISPSWYAESTYDSITIIVSYPGDYSYFSYSLRNLDGTIIAGPTSYSTKTTWTVTGLEPETSYLAYLSWSTTTVGQGNYDSTTVITSSKPTFIDYWNWNQNNGSATAALTRTAYNAIQNRGAVASFSYLVWNDIVDKVKEILDEVGDPWDTRYTTYSGARMSSSDRTLTADKFNSVSYNIGLRVSTGINTQYPGDIVYGDYFITLTDCINTWIDQL